LNSKEEIKEKQSSSNNVIVWEAEVEWLGTLEKTVNREDFQHDQANDKFLEHHFP